MRLWAVGRKGWGSPASLTVFRLSKTISGVLMSWSVQCRDSSSTLFVTCAKSSHAFHGCSSS